MDAMEQVIDDDAQAIQADAPRKRMTVFRGGEGGELTQERMPFAGVDQSVLAGFAKLMAVGAGERHAETTRVLFSEPGETGMSLVYAWFKSGYVLPRHSHNADCLYYVLAGELKLGSQILRKGDGVFIPADAGYTYEVGGEGVEVLEFRNATHFNILFKHNDEAHWDRMATVYGQRGDGWTSEVPPSSR